MCYRDATIQAKAILRIALRNIAIYCYIEIFVIILAKRRSVCSVQSTSYEVQNIGSLGDLGE